jgi:hypothetical protein
VKNNDYLWDYLWIPNQIPHTVYGGKNNDY